MSIQNEFSHLHSAWIRDGDQDLGHSFQGLGHTFIVTCILQEIILEHPHEDGGQEAGEKQHRDARVDDAEPVDLRASDR